MKLNPNLKLRQVGRKYMVVDAATGAANMTNVFTFNASAAMLWERIGENSFEAEDLATARGDVEKLLRCWVDGGLVMQ